MRDTSVQYIHLLMLGDCVRQSLPSLVPNSETDRNFGRHLLAFLRKFPHLVLMDVYFLINLNKSAMFYLFVVYLPRLTLILYIMAVKFVGAYRHFDSPKVRLVRRVFTDKSIKGSLYLDDALLCSTLEPSDKAIPLGQYQLSFGKTPNFSRFYLKANYTYQFRVLDVPGREGILIHIGNYPSDSEGCILVGVDNGRTDMVSTSTQTYLRLCDLFSCFGKLHECTFASFFQQISFDLIVEEEK